MSVPACLMTASSENKTDKGFAGMKTKLNAFKIGIFCLSLQVNSQGSLSGSSAPYSGCGYC